MPLLVLLLAMQQAPVVPAPRRPAAATVNVEIRVTDRTGTPTGDAWVVAEGPASRDGVTNQNGMVIFRTMTAGVYRIRAKADGFTELEKEVTLRAGATPSVIEFALSKAAAPPPPPPPPAPVEPPALPAATLERGAPGAPVTVSIPDMAERSLGGRAPVNTVPIACAGVSNARLLVVKETLPPGTHPDESQMLYLVAGEATLKIADKEQAMAPGWLGVIPRATNYSVARKGRNPAILLSFVAGHPCGAPVAADAVRR